MTRIGLMLLAVALVCTGGAAAATIEGRVMLGDEPLAGVKIEAHATLDPSGTSVFVSAPTAADGRYSLELPPGRYALFARDAGRRLFAFCGRNPVSLAEETVLWAGLQAVPAEEPRLAPYDDATGGAVEGRVLFDGKPLEGAVVYLYLDVADELKGQGFRTSAPTVADGVFAFDGVPESDYHLVARRRADGGRVGPVLEGDYLALASANPIPVKAGHSTQVTLHAVRKVREEAGSATFSHGGTVLRGTVVDAAGKPVAGLHVFAYRDRVIGHQRPAALSPPTAADGNFALEFAAAGVYYVGARQFYGDSPAPGELFGMYDVSTDHGLEIRTGATPQPIRIVVEPVRLN